ncbi:PAS domain-containing protein [Kineococcus glutinatus]|uniref:PAS domain-containing protein n=1 Tax=Kineococcus glutinatus TaxID=1070872 RepID=A0ABP9HSH5_9ACTN
MSTTAASRSSAGQGRREIRPTGVERTFGADELIVSKTDTRGVITYANDVFCRISGYSAEQVLGQPHNLIRHPGMPRAVFALLWSELGAGREVFAYIDNLAADGASYWVLAHVTPSRDAGGRVVGYHSNRRKPHPAGIAAVKPLYERLLAEERRHPGAKAATAAGSALLAELLAERGRGYEEFIWSVIPEELS